MMQNYSSAVKTAFDHVGNFILLGLTGRTGSGCTTAARILSNKTTFINHTSKIYKTPNDLRKLKIVERNSIFVINNLIRNLLRFHGS